MGQKTKPLGFRLGVNRTWDSRWFGTKLYADQLHQDLNLRKYLFNKLSEFSSEKYVPRSFSEIYLILNELLEHQYQKTKINVYHDKEKTKT